MFEDLGLSPLSQEDIQQITLEDLQQVLKQYTALKETKAIGDFFEKPTEDDEERYNLLHWVENDTLPLREAVSGNTGPLKSDLIGWNVGQLSHPIAERAVRRAFEHPQLKPAAERIVRAAITPDETLVGAAKEIDKTYGLVEFLKFRTVELPEERPFLYDYFMTVLAKGNADSRLSYITTLFGDHRYGFEARQKELVKEMEERKMLLYPLSSLCELEYKLFISDVLRKAIGNKGKIATGIPFYLSDSLTFLEESEGIHLLRQNGTYRFRLYGLVGETVDNVMERTHNAGFFVKKVNEHLDPIEEPVYFHSVRF